MSQLLDDPLIGGREALKEHRWHEAFELFTKAAETGATLAASDLEGLAESAWWTGKLDDCLAARERAFSSYLDEGNNRAAAGCAIFLARDYMGRLAPSLGMGWFGRAERLLENDPDCVESGYLMMGKADGARSAGQFDTAIELAESMTELGTRFNDRDLQAFGVLNKGMALVAKGSVKEGLQYLDESTVAAVSGELGPLASGAIYCMAITSTSKLGEYRRAGEWTEAARRWCERQSISGFPGVCRVHRAQILHLRGEWDEAEVAVRLALAELKDFNLATAGEGFYELGEIRFRMGDLEGAEEAFRQAEELGNTQQPGMSMVWLAQGKVDRAWSGIRQALTAAADSPLEKVRLLSTYVQVAVQAGELEAADAAAVQLETIAADYGTPALFATAVSSRGSIQLAQGAATDAIESLTSAAKLWREADVPFETTRSRVKLGQALRAIGDEGGATNEFEAAAATFKRLGAAIDLREVYGLMGMTVEGTKTAARVVRSFMFTDIVRSTNLVEAIGDQAWEHLLAWHDKTIRSLFLAHNGEEVKHVGDGFFVVFADPEQAHRCAVAIQRTLMEHQRMQGFAPEVRIGLHVGETSEKEGDYAGKEVHLAARVGALANGQQILASQSFLTALGTEVPIIERRLETLKGIADPVDVGELEWREVG